MLDSTLSVPRTTWQGGICVDSIDEVVVEVPVALVYNGISHVVMMANPCDLEDLALGFSLSEGILAGPSQLLDLSIEQRDQGVEVAMEISASAFAALKARRRTLAGRTGCGLCGVESLSQLVPLAARVDSDITVTHTALQLALETIQKEQLLKAKTGGVHGAAWYGADGKFEYLREDVGRHNALDKLLGAVAHAGDTGPGFVLVTSRASYEMVAKAAARNIPLLAAVSAPTTMAIQYAQDAGLTLVGFVQPGRHVIYSSAERIIHCEENP